jgi:uncharacterized protein (DUF111 family)
MKAAYFDCQFGAAGDMLLGALFHAGLDRQSWLEQIAKLSLPEGSYHVTFEKVQRRTLAAMKVHVNVKEEYRQEHEHHHHDEQALADDRVNGHGDGGEAFTRQMSDVQKIIEDSPIDASAKDLARRIIKRLGDCEGPVHGMAPDAVYFHEVGGVDTIVDIVGFAIGYHMLGIEKSYVSAVPIGRGRVKTMVGYFPVPAPAVALMLATIKAPTLDFEIDYECLTPTAVAILAEISTEWGKLPRFKAVTDVGYGAGTIDSPNWPNVCRVMLGEI